MYFKMTEVQIEYMTNDNFAVSEIFESNWSKFLFVFHGLSFSRKF